MSNVRSLNEVRAVFFDADGTLFSIHPSVGAIYSESCRRHGIEVSAAEVDSVLPSIWAKHSSENYNIDTEYVTSQEREVIMWKSICKSILEPFTPLDNFDVIFRDIYEAFAKKESRKLFEGVELFLSLLKSDGVTTGILSNNDDRLEPLIAEMPISSYIDHVFPASVIGFKKPSRACFGEVEKRINHRPSEVLFVGDDYDVDYRGAKDAGWHAVWFNRQSQDAPHGECPDSVASFRELKELWRSRRR